MRFWIGNRAHGALVSAIILTVATTATAQNTAPVGVDTVLAEPLSQTVPVAGRFVARQAGAVAARTEGAITEMTVQIGDHVTAGDVLAVFDVDRLSWRRDLARATAREMEGRLAAANSELSKKKAELTRLEGIRSSAAFNQARYDNAIQDVAIAEGTVAAAAAVLARERAALKLAEDDLRHGRLKAPYNGVVSRRHTEAGAYVRVGDPVVSLVNQDDLEIEADVGCRGVERIHIERRVRRHQSGVIGLKETLPVSSDGRARSHDRVTAVDWKLAVDETHIRLGCLHLLELWIVGFAGGTLIVVELDERDQRVCITGIGRQRRSQEIGSAFENGSALGSDTLALSLRTGPTDRGADFGVIKNELRVLEEVLSYLIGRGLLDGGPIRVAFAAR